MTTTAVRDLAWLLALVAAASINVGCGDACGGGGVPVTDLPGGGGDETGDDSGDDVGDDTGVDTGDDTDSEPEPVDVAFAPRPTLMDARVEAVRVAIPDASGCQPSVGAWALTALLDGRFCRYEWTGATAPSNDDLPYSAECDAGGVEQACWGYGYGFMAALHKDGYAATPEPYMADHLSVLFLRQAERITALVPEPGGVALPARVRVAVVDSMPDGPHLDASGQTPPAETSQQPEAHGHAVGWIVHTLACESNGWLEGSLADHPCLADVTYNKALHEGVVEKHGRPDQLADAIERAVADWTADVADPTVEVAGHGMVINLSLGWHPDYSDFVSEEIVRTAIERAVCRGALVIAAAGNSPGGQDEGSGPFYPARFAAEGQPEQAACVAIGVPVGEQKLGNGGDLVTAIAGTTLADEALQTTMPDGTPFISAPALHAVVPTLPAPPPDNTGLATGPHEAFTASLSGTSAAAAVASAVAAVVWAYRDDLTPRNLVSLMSEASAPTDATPSFCQGTIGGCCLSQLDGQCLDDSVRRLSVCRVLKNALAGMCDPGCVSLNPADCEPCPVGCGEQIEQSAYVSPQPYLVEPDCPSASCQATVAVAAGSVTVAGCVSKVMLVDGDQPATSFPCLDQQVYGRSIMPWVEPLYDGDGEPPDVQPLPDHPPCPNCFAYLDVPDTIELDLQLAPGLPAITGMGMRLQDRSATGTDFVTGVTIDLTSQATALGMVSGARYHLTLVSSAFADLTATGQALLTVTFATEAARSSELGFRLFQ